MITILLTHLNFVSENIPKKSHTNALSFFFLSQYIDEALPTESPYLYGLHPNAEIGFLTQTSEKLFRTVLEMQPRDGGSGEGSGTSRDEKVHIEQNVPLKFFFF